MSRVVEQTGSNYAQSPQIVKAKARVRESARPFAAAGPVPRRGRGARASSEPGWSPPGIMNGISRPCFPEPGLCSASAASPLAGAFPSPAQALEGAFPSRSGVVLQVETACPSRGADPRAPGRFVLSRWLERMTRAWMGPMRSELLHPLLTVRALGNRGPQRHRRREMCSSPLPRPSEAGPTGAGTPPTGTFPKGSLRRWRCCAKRDFVHGIDRRAAAHHSPARVRERAVILRGPVDSSSLPPRQSRAEALAGSAGPAHGGP